MFEQIRQLRGKTGAAAVVGLGAAALWITMLAVIGAIAVSGDDDGGGSDEVTAGALPGASFSGSGGEEGTATSAPAGGDGDAAVPQPGQPALPGASSSGGGSSSAGGGSAGTGSS